MFRRTLSLMAGGALLALALMGAGPASAQAKKIVLATPGIPPIFSVMIAVRRGEAGLLQEARRRRHHPAVR